MSYQIRPTGFSILPPAIKNILIINALVFFTQVTFKLWVDDFIINYFALHSVFSEYFQIHQLITHLFLHGSFTHLFLNMFALWMFGSVLENVFGTKRFVIFYFICGFGAAFFHLAYLAYEQYPIYKHLSSYYDVLSSAKYEVLNQKANLIFNQATVGASGAVFGCLAAFGYMFPNAVVYLYFLFPIKVKWFIIFYIAYEVYEIFLNSPGDNVARLAHLGGAFVGFLLVYLQKKGKKLF